MNIIKKNSLLQVIYIGLFFIFLYSCDGGKKSNSTQKKNNMTISDSRLQIGEVLTPLGCLIYGPWQPMNTNYGYNGAIYFENKEISSELQLFTEVEKQLVFELQKDGSLKYWFKKDYERHPTAEDSEYEKQGITRTTHFNPQVDHIKKIYTKGNWSVN